MWGGGGAGERNRTPDLLITNELLYRLSYSGFALAESEGANFKRFAAFYLLAW